MSNYQMRLYKKTRLGESGGASCPIWVWEVEDWESGMLMETGTNRWWREARDEGKKALERWRARG